MSMVFEYGRKGLVLIYIVINFLYYYYYIYINYTKWYGKGCSGSNDRSSKRKWSVTRETIVDTSCLPHPTELSQHHISWIYGTQSNGWWCLGVFEIWSWPLDWMTWGNIPCDLLDWLRGLFAINYKPRDRAGYMKKVRNYVNIIQSHVHILMFDVTRVSLILSTNHIYSNFLKDYS